MFSNKAVSQMSKRLEINKNVNKQLVYDEAF